MSIPPPPSLQNAIIVSALDIIKSGLRLCNVIAAGEDIDAATANDGLMVLNQMIDAWNADRLAIFTTGSNDFPLVLGKQSYTLGSGGDFDMTRPVRIESMSAILLYAPDNPVEVPMALYTVDQWQNQVPVKNVTGNFPQLCYDDGNYPLRNLNFWPIPQGQPCNVRIYSWQPLLLASSLNTTINLPAGYSEAFRYNLAVRLSAEFAATLPQTIPSLAVESLARLRSLNAPELTLNSDLQAGPAGYNYKADLFGIGF